jgi:hypothetical protein
MKYILIKIEHVSYIWSNYKNTFWSSKIFALRTTILNKITSITLYIKTNIADIKIKIKRLVRVGRDSRSSRAWAVSEYVTRMHLHLAAKYIAFICFQGRELL